VEKQDTDAVEYNYKLLAFRLSMGSIVVVPAMLAVAFKWVQTPTLSQLVTCLLMVATAVKIVDAHSYKLFKKYVEQQEQPKEGDK